MGGYYDRRVRADDVAIGDMVVVDGQSYRVVSKTDYGEAVCENMREDCYLHDDCRTFDDLDFDRIVKASDVSTFQGAGI